MNEARVGTQAMVVSPHYLASAAGNGVLRKGGNAFDAAVAVSACLAVVYPHMTGLGGDSFWMTYHRSENKVRGYNGSGRSGSGITRDLFAGLDSIPTRGIHSIVTVPGMVDSWDAVLKEYGRLSLAEVLEPAITYAASGFPFSKDQHVNTTEFASFLSSMPKTASIYLPNNRVPLHNEKFVQKQLADTLKLIAANGRDEFYKGELAWRIVTSLHAQGGMLNQDDFADHSGCWTEPLHTSYRNHTIYQMPPNSQGFVGLMALNLLENFDLQAIPHGSYDYYHLLIEALKRCFRDRNQVLTDPDFHPIPIEHLLSKAYAKELSQGIQMNLAGIVPTQPVGNDTAHAAVVDSEGNAVSFIQSLYFEFGSGVVAGDTGILLQNRGSFFSLDPSHINTLEPRKRTFHTLMPAMVFKEGSPYILYGTQGGEGQPQTQTLMLTRMLDYGMNPQQAISEPRFVWGRTWGEATEELRVEDRIHGDVIQALHTAGHKVNVVGSMAKVMGHANAIMIDENGFLHGGVDPRADGAVMGW
ncbi:gamma-glutamyltransferase [Bacillus sp. FJAT-27264]|uniref:gamma-glutamyltransferase n=1 Tax=Paenibacillus sp. (strain DSM 101736 / FJAT-27264) TaxID=1850362 RepID=UPI000807CE4C|nr:gamma-glutamyltransferase [Bacillus sp. FJAT-27264]OBZ19017.1 gamma-glutamyltransferase [Bacillus sp. FJAT-27264]